MSAPVDTLRPEDLLATASSLVRDRRFRHVPVLSGAGALVGMLSDRDLLHHAGREREVRVGDIMAVPVLSASPDTGIREIARLFFEERIGAMPIVDSAEALVGILTRSDILRALVHEAPFDLWI